MTDFNKLAKGYMEEKFPEGDPTASNDPLARVLLTMEKDQDIDERTTEAIASNPEEMDEGAAPDTPSSPGSSKESEANPSPPERNTESSDEPEQFELEQVDVEQSDDAVRGHDVTTGSDPSPSKPPTQLIYGDNGLEVNHQEFEPPDIRLESEADVSTEFNPGIQDTTIVPQGDEQFTKMLDDVDKKVVVPEYKSPDAVHLPTLPPVPNFETLIPNAADHQMVTAGVNLMNWERQ